MLRGFYRLFFGQAQGNEVAVGRFDLRVVIYKEDDDYIAHCLEMDIMGTGGTLEIAIEEMKRLVEAQISYCFDKHIEDTLLSPAPPEYWRRLLHAKPYTPQKPEIPVNRIRRVDYALVES
ncbi:MAG: hypothetical protein A3E19_04895 [Planctomycetes bacterium RIFCSPHIGHO2_12_FULL_52_36]|nr:MAG: hypothetical protein A3E19_04895 [Planctomycetes bacterium RIFCSPHIGHO2_12_FULL_52_36]